MGQSSSNHERRPPPPDSGRAFAIPGGMPDNARHLATYSRRNSTSDEKYTTDTAGHRRLASTAATTRSAAQRANNLAGASSQPNRLSANLDSSVPLTRTNNGGDLRTYIPASSLPVVIPGTVDPADDPSSPRTENALELLREYDTVFLIDDSGSMAGALWREAGQALAWVAQVASQYDDDGIDIYFLNSKERGNNLRSKVEVETLFARVQPRGSTPTGARLDKLLRSYISTIERAQREYDSSDPEVTGIKPVNYIVITDGAPTDDPESVIVAAAKRLDKGEFPLTQAGIQFVQIGSDTEATKALEELDDNLSGKYNIRDIVDTTLYKSKLDGETLVKILLGGINKRVDICGGAAVLRS